MKNCYVEKLLSDCNRYSTSIETMENKKSDTLEQQIVILNPIPVGEGRNYPPPPS